MNSFRRAEVATVRNWREKMDSGKDVGHLCRFEGPTGGWNHLLLASIFSVGSLFFPVASCR